MPNEDTYIDRGVIVPKKRDLQTLLSLGTYQGMTDEEIESIMMHYQAMSFQSGLTSVKAQVARDMRDRSLELMEQSYAHGLDMLESNMSTGLDLQVVERGETE